MKAIKFLSSVAIAATMMTSCGQRNTVELNDRVDSFNYAMGYLNGSGILQQVQASVQIDSLTGEDLAKFVEGFNLSYRVVEGDEKLQLDAIMFAVTHKAYVQNNKLFNDSTIEFNEEIFRTMLEKTMNGEELPMTTQEGIEYVQRMMFVPLDSGVVRTQGMIDSINTAFAIVNGTGAREELLSGDTTLANVDKFLAYFYEELNKEEDKLRFEGMRIGSTMFKNLSGMEYLMNDTTIPTDLDIIGVALAHRFENIEKPLMTEEVAEAYFNAYIEERQARDDAKKAEEAAPRIQEGADFLTANKEKPGVQVTESGLQYLVIKEGKGARPTAESTVNVHYEGRLLDGTVFDSSYQRGESISFPLNQVIKGWTEGVQLMTEGSKYTFFIPYNLAYGETGAGESIPPFSTLIFDVELLKIEK